MKKIILLLLFVGVFSLSNAQMHDGDDDGHPDSLETVTVSGTVIINNYMGIDIYLLDADNDSTADYFLNFGPVTYEPDSSNAERPQDGDEVTITGGLVESFHGDMGFIDEDMNAVVVYEINGEFWHEPYTGFWDDHEGDDDDDDGDFNPDSLETVTVTGTVIVQNYSHHPKYFLDEDNDAVADYRLNFGPFWYEPDSSNAVRPSDGDVVTIQGGLHESYDEDMNTIVVYEINAEFWRDPYYAYWNDLDGRFDGGMKHHGNHNGYAFGWKHDSISTVSLSGITLVDTTFIMTHYYIDTNNDSIPEYFLNFGPWWFEPASGAVRPADGDSVEITGGLIGGSNLSMLVVYTVNGLEWRDSTYFHGNMGGRWIHGDMNNPVTVHNPYDEDDYFEVEPGWKNGNGHHGGGMMNPDSLFCRILELYPENVPFTENENPFMGFEIGVFSPDGSNNMKNNGRMGGHMNFNNRASFQFRYNDIQVKGNNIDEGSISAKYWDDQSNSWVTLNDASVDAEANTVTFASAEVPNYVILTADKVTAVDNKNNETKPNDFVLEQNYPNPFNPATTIEFKLNKANRVQLNIYNVLGQKISTLIDKNLESGVYKYQFDGRNLASGIYFYELKAGNVSSVKKMNLLK